MLFYQIYTKYKLGTSWNYWFPADTVKPVLSGHLITPHPLLSGQ